MLKFREGVKRFTCLFIALIMVLSLVSVAFAEEVADPNSAEATAVDDSADAAIQELYNAALTGTAEKNYELKDGGSITGNELWTQDGKSVGDSITSSAPMDINEPNYERLTSSAQSQFVKDFDSQVQSKLQAHKEELRSNGGTYEKSWFNEGTVSNWYKRLQLNSTVGTKLMQNILAGTKPDFATAQKLYQPFAGVVGTVMGILSILIIAVLGIVMVLDIAYIVLPPFRMIVGEKGKGAEGGKGGITSNLISNAAIKAVEVEEQGNEDKSALAYYFKKRVVALILLGICLLYLVNGQIYTLVGWILDLVSGFLGF